MNLIKIQDVEGNILYEGIAKSRKAYVQSLIRANKSLARANLKGANLTGCNLDDGDFEGANLDGADLRGTRAKFAKFVGASLRGVVAEGFQAKRADLTGADLSPHPEYGTPTRMDGAILQFARLDLAVVEGVSFRNAGLSSISLCGAKVKNSDFTNAYMHNVDYNDAFVEHNEFSETDMTPTMNIPEAHLPDRTRGATIRNNRYHRTKIGKGNDLFRRDSMLGKAAPIAYSGVAALALATGWAFTGEVSFETMRDFVGNNTWGFIGVASAWIVGKDQLEDRVKDVFINITSATTAKVRAATAELVSRGNALKNMSVAFMTGRASDALQRAMRDVDAPALKTIKANITGEVDVIIADRKKLAAALRRLSDTVLGRFTSQQDLIISRICDRETDRHAPSAMILRRNGDIEAVWDDGAGNLSEMKWDRAGFPISNEPGFQGPQITHVREIKKFIEATLRDNNVMNFDFDPTTHSIRAGRDDSIVVQNRETAMLDNPYGPSVLTPDGVCFYYRNARPTDERFKPIKKTQQTSTFDGETDVEVAEPRF